jgi:hypothetical protein
VADMNRSDWSTVDGLTMRVPEDGDPDREATSTFALFEGDEGALALAQRKALVALLKNRFISSRTNPKEYAAIAANPRVIQARLNDLFLDLVVSRQHEVAYKRQVVSEGSTPFPTLLYDRAWGREETMLLVYLRSRYRNQSAAGVERVYVDRVDMYEYAEQHRPPSATDVAGDRKRVQNAIIAIAKSDLLIGRSDGDRFEISNAIEVLLPIPKLRELLGWLQTQNGTAPDAPDEDAAARTEPGTHSLPGTGVRTEAIGHDSESGERA